MTFTYDASGMLTSVSDPLNHQTSFTYNSAGQVVTATDALQHTIQFGYDSGDLVSTTDPLNRTVTRYVDAAGRATQVTNPLGEVSRFEFDALNQATRGIDATQGATQLAYDGNGNLLSVTDARNSVTSYIYDNRDRVTTRRDPLLHDETYLYDLNGNLAQLTDRKNQVTTFTYDALNRLTHVTYEDTSTTTYTYDAGNRVTQVVDSLSGTITYGYDNLDRLTSETTPLGSISYTYDTASRLTSMTVTGQPTVNYSHDSENRLTQISQGSSTVLIAYDDIGRRTSLTLPNGIVTEYGYNAASQLTSLTYKQGGNIIGDLTYEYDNNGRRTRMGGSYARSITPPTLSAATYNAANQQLSFGSQTLTYDLNGNLTSDSSNSYTWDARDQLATITGPGVNASLQYNAAGSRTSKTVNDTTTSFLYDGANIVQEQSAQTGNANLLNGGIDEIFLRTDASGAFSPLSDALGSSLSLTDASGTAQTAYTYGAFGQPATTGSASSNTSQYTNRENDGTGLQYNRARYYSPTLQRFISEDPMGFAGGDINLYAYAANSPANFTDPSGMAIEGLDTRPHLENAGGGRPPTTAGRGGYPPTSLQALFGDGGIFTGQTLGELISAKERSRQPCKRFGERWLDSFTETNQVIPGMAAPLGTSMIAAPGAAQITGAPGVLGWAWRGGGPGFGSAALQSGATAIATHASFEGGIAVGSYVTAVSTPCGY